MSLGGWSAASQFPNCIGDRVDFHRPGRATSPISGTASAGMGGKRRSYSYSLTMTQEANRSPGKPGAAAGRASVREPAGTAAGAGQAHGAGAGPVTGSGPVSGAGPVPSAAQTHTAGQKRGASRPVRKPQGRPSLGGGEPARDRELRAQGRETVRKLLDAGMIEFEERGFNGVRVDDVVRRAGISHGTFYLYFSNKEDLFKALLRDALHDMKIVAGDFPVVTSDETGLKVLRQWVRKFFAAYNAHATVLRILSSANAPGEMFADGLRLFYSIAESMI